MQSHSAPALPNGERRPGLPGLWLLLAALVFVFSFGVGYFYSVVGLIVAVALVVLGAPRSLQRLGSIVAAGFGVYFMSLIPGTTGSELIVALLATMSFATALYTWPRRPVAKISSRDLRDTDRAR
jgi:drug/metabolite transporter (DMT)-like permease